MDAPDPHEMYGRTARGCDGCPHHLRCKAIVRWGYEMRKWYDPIDDECNLICNTPNHDVARRAKEIDKLTAHIQADLLVKYPRLGKQPAPNVKLDPEKVRQIRALYLYTKMSYREIADMYEVDKTTIGRAVNRQTWAHVE